ncbi:major facilitator superfamily MFS_1 [Streptomyces bingchenggensis BCW-1]|uniref:Major facilitator superfamily MFS_1 n=1 Tax=Streptomyces bingchenggensis (strain BCW-1) TaxID=749414 RepID=D7C052_STRBB|nr:MULTISPECIES: MFS transporter [Streptomyces]ADI12092.1 major facilitator superfamily MFS_1 [Streptomyces bingchenggensis BCW-1]
MADPSHGSYREVLSRPAAWHLLAAAGLARLAMGMVGLALVLSVREATGSFAAAGFAAGAFALTAGVFAAARGRLVDLRGHRRGLRVLGAGYALAGCALLVLVTTVREPAALIAASGMLGAVAPPVSATTRTAWADIVGRGPRLSTALSLDTVTEELLSLVGPVSTGLLVAESSPLTALATAIALEVTAVGLFPGKKPGAASPPSAMAAGHGTPRLQGSHRVLAAVGPVLVPLLAAGVGFGVLDVAVPALALQHGGTVSAGWMLALLPAGSTLGGLAYGRRTWSSPLVKRYRWLCLALVVGFAPLPLIAGDAALWPLLLVAGLAIAPTVVTGYLLVDEATPDGRKTEAATWVSTFNNTGTATGSALCGALIAGVPLAAVFALPAVAVTVGTLGMVLWHRNLPVRAEAASGQAVGPERLSRRR